MQDTDNKTPPQLPPEELSWKTLIIGCGVHDFRRNKNAGPDRLEFHFHTEFFTMIGFLMIFIGGIAFFNVPAYLPLYFGITPSETAAAIINSLIPLSLGLLMRKFIKRDYSPEGGPLIRADWIFDTPFFIDKLLMHNISLFFFGIAAIELIVKWRVSDPLNFGLIFISIFIAGLTIFMMSHKVMVFDRARGIFINGRMAPETVDDIGSLKAPGLFTSYFLGNDRVFGLSLNCEVPAVIEFRRIRAVQLINREDEHPEANLVYDGIERLPVAFADYFDDVAECAMDIAEFMNVPLLVEKQPERKE